MSETGKKTPSLYPWYEENRRDKETPDFVKWFEDREKGYGRPEDFDDHEDDPSEYWIRRSFALMGWLALPVRGEEV